MIVSAAQCPRNSEGALVIVGGSFLKLRIPASRTSKSSISKSNIPRQPPFWDSPRLLEYRHFGFFDEQVPSRLTLVPIYRCPVRPLSLYPRSVPRGSFRLSRPNSPGRCRPCSLCGAATATHCTKRHVLILRRWTHRSPDEDILQDPLGLNRTHFEHAL